jgi:hypothetical protein
MEILEEEIVKDGCIELVSLENIEALLGFQVRLSVHNIDTTTDVKINF